MCANTLHNEDLNRKSAELLQSFNVCLLLQNSGSKVWCERVRRLYQRWFSYSECTLIASYLKGIVTCYVT